MISFAFILETIFLSTILYVYLHRKTRISLNYLYKDNLGVILPVSAGACYLSSYSDWIVILTFLLFIPVSIIGLSFTYTMIRFWRTPKRKVNANLHDIVSPADGNVIYIRRIDAGVIPISVKNQRSFVLKELVKSELLTSPCWLIGINMTPFDVHKNCSPIDGKIILNFHYQGKFLSLKDRDAVTDNERNTYIIENKNLKIGVVQIASRLVRRIDSYVIEGQSVKRGDWLGMIRFGSQVDVILPIDYEPSIKVGQQLYAALSVIATKA